MTEGYWISPEGDVFPTNNHFEFLVDNLKKFGFSKKYIREQSHSPALIIIRAIENGWIRIRRSTPDLVIQIWLLNPDRYCYIRSFLIDMEEPQKKLVFLEELQIKSTFNKTVGWFLSDESLPYVRNPGRRNG